MKYIKILTLPILLLASCNGSLNETPYAETLDVYQVDLLQNDDDPQLEKVKERPIEVMFFKSKKHIPYLTFATYASLFDPHFPSDVTSAVAHIGTGDVWTVTRAGKLLFSSTIDYETKVITTFGSLEDNLKEGDNPRDLSLLYQGMDLEEETFYTTDNPSGAKYSYNEYDINQFVYNGEHYLPLGLYDVTYSNEAGLYFTYNYAHIFSSHEPDHFADVPFIENKRTYSVNTQMAAKKKSSSMPNYLKKYNANLFFYVLDNFYGLKNTRFKNAIDFCKANGTYQNLTTSNNFDRVQAYADTLAYLDDHHTALVSASGGWGGEPFVRRRYGENCLSRTNLAISLRTNRPKQLGANYESGSEIIYSTDRRIAMFLFDSFIFGTKEEVYDSNGSLKSDAWKYDTIINLVKKFEALKKVSSVKNVILDMSTNGGGVVGVLMKVMSLISKNNDSYLTIYDAINQQVDTVHTRIDSNNDGLYDENDVYGNDFNFYLLTSDVSFSCGNALPYYAKAQGLAKTIGQKSGGGECAIAVHYLPNSEYVYHSSHLHIGDYDKENKVFYGVESGAEPDITLNSTSSFYDLDKLARYI